MKKRLTATLLSLCLLLTLLPAPVFAAGAADSGIPSAQSMVTQQNNAGGDSMATPSDAQPEECTCETFCTGDNINGDCPVCGAEEADLTACEGLEAQPATPSNALPVTALTAGEIELYIGGQQITESGCYENQNDTWTKVDGTEAASGQFYYDASTATLTLNNVSIEGGSGMEDTLSLQTTDSEASLKIVLKGENYLTGGVPIQVYAENNNASLTITGEGTLTTTGTGSGGAGGIFVQSGPMESTNGSYLTIEGGANVISNCTQTTAVTLVAPAAGEAILTVQDGNLTADGGSSAGIYYDKLDGSVPPDDHRYLRIADNSVVRTNRLAHATGLSAQIQYNTSSGGIYMSKGEGIVYGHMELQEDFEIGEGESLTLAENASLSAGSHNVIVDGGTLDEGLAEDLGNSVIYKVIKVGLDKSSLTLDVGSTAILTATITPSNATNQNVTWSSDNENVATVEDGKVTAAAQGSANITATAADGSGEKATCTVTVNAPTTVPVTGVSLNKASTTLTVGTSETLTATVLPDNATNKAVTWSSNDSTVATVDESGKVTAVAPGEATITVTTEDGSKTATCTVIVHTATTITTQPQSVSVTEGQSATFSVTATGDNLRYQWQINSGNGWSAITGATDASYTIDRTTTAMSGNQYRCIVTGNGGETTSSAATLTVRSYEPPYTGKYSYEIVSDVGENGTIDVDRYATEGDQVTITVSPDEAYLLDDLTVTSGGKDVALTDNGDGTYTFTMPSGDVAITATFAEDPNWTNPEDPSTDVSEIFTDVPANHWAQAAIQYVYDNGLMTGVSDTAFAPEATTTRAMIVAMLARLENVTSAESAGFTDVAADDWYATAVNWAASEGIVGGFGDDTFAPNDPITREQLAAMLMKYAQYKGQDTTARADLSHYSDAENISSWANDVLSWAVAEGLLTGVTDDTIAPQVHATRAQVAAILQRFLSE